MQKRSRPVPIGRETLENLIALAGVLRKLAKAGVRVEIRCETSGYMSVVAGDYEFVRPRNCTGCYSYHPFGKDTLPWRDVEPEEIGSLTQPPLTN